MPQAAASADGTLAKVYWGEGSVLERSPQLIELASATGRGGFKFVARTPDPAGRHLDGLLGIVTGLASQRRDNPLLIQQTEGSAWLRSDTLRDTGVDVLRYGERNLYWLTTIPADVALRGQQREPDPTVGGRPAHPWRPGHSRAAGRQVVDISTITELYEATTSG